jgi:hypothetical protein
MRRFSLLTILASSALHATSFTSASCSLGTTGQTVTGSTSSNCSIPAYVDGNYVGYVGGYGEVTGSLSGFGIGVDAGGGFVQSGSSSPDVGFFGGGEATYSQTFSTTGPERPGFILANIDGFGPNWNAYISQKGTSCCASGTLSPFELGEVFQVYLTASGGAGGPLPCDPACAGGESSAGISIFQLTEADGTTPVPFFVTPEPATWGFLLFGLGACALRYIHTRKAGLDALEASTPNSKL